MGAYQNLFNQVLATGVAGVALGQHTATTKEQAKENSINNMGKLADTKKELNREKISLEAENLRTTDEAIETFANLQIDYDKNLNKALNGKITMKTLKKRIAENRKAHAEAFESYGSKIEQQVMQRDALNERISILNKQIDLSGEKYKKVLGETSPVSKLKDTEFVNKSISKRIDQKVAQEQGITKQMDKLNKIKGGKK